MPKTEGSGPRLLQEITARNLLSFGPEGISLELRPLNVLIGPNGSGKSNFLELIGLLHAAPTQLSAPVREGGGIQDWIWKGQPNATAVLEVVVDSLPGSLLLRHTIEFAGPAQKFELVDERIDYAEAAKRHSGSGPYFLYRFQRGRPVLSVTGEQRQAREREIQPEDLLFDESILSQRKDPDQYPELTRLGQVYGRIRLYREWSFGRKTVFRRPQRADLRNDRLEEDGSNLGLFLSRLSRHPRAKDSLLDHLRDLYDGLKDFQLDIEGGTVQVFFTEGTFTIPATRLSDGSLRYLCLLAILCDPDPPPLICIEEPELGLHPDLLHKLADLLVDASHRCQLIVTTHSEILVDALTEHPDSVVVCEKQEAKTTMERLDPSELAPWLERYRLGQLWTKGEIGGVRW
jgi:predicted ATPase